MGKIPKEGGVLLGFHVLPNRKSNIPIFAIAGTPFINKNKQINATARMDVHAAIKNIAFIMLSLYFVINAQPLKSQCKHVNWQNAPPAYYWLIQ
jgi:hypothetical protein